MYILSENDMLFKDPFLKNGYHFGKKKIKSTIPKKAFFCQGHCLKTCNKCLLNKDVVQVPTRLLGLDILQRVLGSAYLQMDVG